MVAHLRAALRAGHDVIEAHGRYGKTVALRDLQLHHPKTHYLALTIADADIPYLQSLLQSVLNPQQTIILDDVHLLAKAEQVCPGTVPANAYLVAIRFLQRRH